MRYVIGIDGGGTRTTLALAEADGREVMRRTGPAGLVDPRDPGATVGVLTKLVRETLLAANVDPPVAALCAGLAGVDHPPERAAVASALQDAGLAERIVVRSDGETALYGALKGGPGLLLISGTGSVAFGRGEDGRMERCGGWGMVIGDEGSGYAIGRSALAACMWAFDGRGPETGLLPELLKALELERPEALPSWAGRARKAEIAALAVPVFRLAETGDEVAKRIVQEAADALVAHAEALARRLGSWLGPVPIVLHGGVARSEPFSLRFRLALETSRTSFDLREPAEDAVSGAVRLALIHSDPS